jgi:HSP20 family protein
MGFHKDDLDFFEGTREDQVERHIRRLLGQQEGGADSWEEPDSPPLDIYETNGLIVVEVELPGIDIGNLEVSVTGGTLIIEGLKRENLEPGRINFLCMERTFGSFRRIIPFLHPVDITGVKAAYRAGILEIQIPILDERRGSRQLIPVTVE